jgi:hypothetical protein
MKTGRLCGSLLTVSQAWEPLDTQKVQSIEYLGVVDTDRNRSLHQLGSAGTQGMRILVRTARAAREIRAGETLEAM